jgi:MFS family permease
LGGFWLLASMCAAWSIATAATPIAFASFGVLLVVRFLLGFFEAVNNPGQTAINTRAFQAHGLARAQAICFSGTQVGPLVGSPVIAWVAAEWSWAAVFYGCAALGLVWVAVWLALAPRLEVGPVASWTTASGASRRGALWPLRQPAVRALAVAGLLWGYAMWLFVSWFPTYLSDAWGLSLKELGWVNTIPTFGGIASILLGGVISDRLVRGGVAVGRARQLLAGIGLTGSAGCIVAAVFAPSAWLSVAGFTLNGLIQGLAVAPLFSLPAVLAPRSAGTIAATMNFAMAMGGVISPTVAGMLRAQSGGWHVAFATAAAAVLFAGLILLVAVRAEPIEDDA